MQFTLEEITEAMSKVIKDAPEGQIKLLVARVFDSVRMELIIIDLEKQKKEVEEKLANN